MSDRIENFLNGFSFALKIVKSLDFLKTCTNIKVPTLTIKISLSKKVFGFNMFSKE